MGGRGRAGHAGERTPVGGQEKAGHDWSWLGMAGVICVLSTRLAPVPRRGVAVQAAALLVALVLVRIVRHEGRKVYSTIHVR